VRQRKLPDKGLLGGLITGGEGYESISKPIRVMPQDKEVKFQ